MHFKCAFCNKVYTVFVPYQSLELKFPINRQIMLGTISSPLNINLPFYYLRDVLFIVSPLYERVYPMMLDKTSIYFNNSSDRSSLQVRFPQILYQQQDLYTNVLSFRTSDSYFKPVQNLFLEVTGKYSYY
jgi:hypothetical protein